MQEKIQNYIIKKSKSFTLEEIKQDLFKNEKPSRFLEDYLVESPFLFPTEKDDHYVPRSTFFNGAEFIITPSKTEIKDGILFSGDRFIPFYPEELFPTESFKIKTSSGQTIKPKEIKFKLEDLYPYYSLLGAENIIDYIIADHHTNQQIIGNPSKKATITVFDFSEIYTDKNFAKCNSLIFKVEDWNNGVFSVLPREATHKNTKWFETLEQSLYKVFEEKGPHLEIPEQLALAYYFSGPNVLKNPPCSIAEFIKQSNKIQIKFHEDNTILWYADKHVTPPHMQTENPVSISRGSIDSLDSILQELGINICSHEIERLIENSIQNGDNSIKPILDKIFPKSGITFKDKAQEAAFYNHLEELWEEVVSKQ